MLRTTISRIRKVCSVGYIPRLLRGDQCNAAVSSAGIRKAHNTSKSTEDGEQATTKKNIDAPAYTLSSATEFKIADKFKKKIGEALVLDKTATDNKQPIVTAGLPLTQRERCQRIIDQAFGKADDTQPDRALSEQYFSGTVNLEDTRREIHESEKAKLKLQEQKIHIDNPLLPDDRTHYGIFKMSRELNLNDDNQDEIVIIDSASAREPDLNKNSENVKETAEETPPVEESYIPPAKEDFDKCVNNLESIEKKALCDNDAETIEMVKGERKSDPYEKATPTYQPFSPSSMQTSEVLNATTAKEDEELLNQKLETIEETPIVEAQKPKLEGFNVTPRVLRNEPTLNSKILENNQDKSCEVDLPRALEEVSKRCLNCPLGQIDEMLINEMEKLGMTIKTAQKSPSTPMKDDLVQMDVTNKQPNSTIVRTAQKASSTPMGDDIVQMEALNTLPNSIIEEQEIYSERPELDENENKTATDSRRIPGENEQDEALRKSEEIVKPAKEEGRDILYPGHIRVQLNPVSSRSKEYNPTDDYNSSLKFSCCCLPQAAELNKQKIEDTLPNRSALNKSFEEPFSLDGPLLKGPLSETPNSHAFIINQTAEPYSIQSREGNVFGTAQNPHTATAAAESEKTSAEDINTNVPPFDPLNDASNNIRHEEFLKPEISSYLEEFNRLSYNATINASKPPAGDENRTPAERGLDENSFYSRNLAAEYESSAFKNINEHQTFPKETDEVENHDKTPIRQSTSEVQTELAEDQTTVNRLFAKEPYTNVSLPGKHWNNEIEHLPTNNSNNTTQQCSNKLYSTERLEPKPVQDSEKDSLPEAILKEHRLDPYYVLTCNETCPISPGSTMSDWQNSDFVDPTETLYMKKNICESLRPKPQPIMECKMTSDTQAHFNDMEFIREALPEIKSTGMPEIKCRSIPNATGSMPKLDEQVAEVALSELLRRVRERSRLTYSEGKSGLEVQAVGKCGKKAPRCHPLAPRSPPNNPVPPPSFGLPMLKRMPPACKPKTKPSNKCSCAANDGEFSPEMSYELSEAEVCAVRSKVNLTDEVIDRLQNLGMILAGVLRRTKSGIETLLVRDYEPWTPIPSWKIPPKDQKKEWQPASPCVNGCPVFPKARASMGQDPPCNLKPCEGFPKRRSFSMLDCFAISLGEKKVYDLGYF